MCVGLDGYENKKSGMTDAEHRWRRESPFTEMEEDRGQGQGEEDQDLDFGLLNLTFL